MAVRLALVALVALMCSVVQGRGFASVSPASSTGSQWQALLLALQRNPSLARHLRASPGGPTLAALEDDCTAVRAENIRLKQLVTALLGEKVAAAAGGSNDAGNNAQRRQGKDLLAQALASTSSVTRNQRELSPAQRLLNQVAQRNVAESGGGNGGTPWTAVQQVLVTPTPTWSSVVESSTYVTTVSSDVTTELPILIRGSKVTTTIVEPSTFTGNLSRVTPNEIKMIFYCINDSHFP
jgi:hypothetical protein